MRVSFKNANLEKLKNIGKDKINETKSILKRIISTNKNLKGIIAHQNRIITRERLGEITQELGYSLNRDQVEVMMYYIDPHHHGHITIDKIDAAVRHPGRLEDTISRDIDGTYTINSNSESSRKHNTNNNRSECSVGTNDRVKILKDELVNRARNGRIREGEFREVVHRMMPHLQTSDVDMIIEEATLGNAHNKRGVVSADNIVDRLYKKNAQREYGYRILMNRSHVREPSSSVFTVNSVIQSGETKPEGRSGEQAVKEPSFPTTPAK